MESVKNFFKRASSLALCACVAGTMLSSFNVYAEGYYDTLGGQFYDNGEVVYENYDLSHLDDLDYIVASFQEED